eukprot:Protomagalhaensia_sp_Gyna_25__132@NODE_1063_length_2232_cov_30_069311_g619_i1_p3_GENE_NODE_1063_length_2232_cov_30_069311_g619_i1NODE_1063_length_2232_cov_30_069311_g619_i1_p3_ORF_typecomplete_len173_score17_59_NODE_1063_length_2232_cov_30_069311_g619_i117132186
MRGVAVGSSADRGSDIPFVFLVGMTPWVASQRVILNQVKPFSGEPVMMDLYVKDGGLELNVTALSPTEEGAYLLWRHILLQWTDVPENIATDPNKRKKLFELICRLLQIRPPLQKAVLKGKDSTLEMRPPLQKDEEHMAWLVGRLRRWGQFQSSTCR